MSARKRMSRSTARERFHAEQLVDRHPTAAECMRGAGHVDQPDAQTLLPDHCARLALRLLEALDPMPQRPRIVRAQAFGIPHFDALARHLSHYFADVHEL